MQSTKKNLACYVNDQEGLTPLEITFSLNVLDIVLRESCQSLIHTHPKFISILTCILTRLMQVAKQKCDEQVRAFSH